MVSGASSMLPSDNVRVKTVRSQSPADLIELVKNLTYNQ